jgi:hypothetical protein
MFLNRCSELLPGTEVDITVVTSGYFEAHAINIDQSTLASLGLGSPLNTYCSCGYSRIYKEPTSLLKVELALCVIN